MAEMSFQYRVAEHTLTEGGELRHAEGAQSQTAALLC